MSELKVIEATSQMLSMHGECEVVYLTAEFSPFSNQQKPDLIFRIDDSFKNQILFVEYKENLSKVAIRQLVDHLIEHEEFVQDSILERFTYIFATNVQLSESTIHQLKDNKIVAIGSIDNELDLYSEILRLIK